MIKSKDWLASIDLKDVFLHVLLAQLSRQYVRFLWGRKHYQFRVLPFDLSLSPWDQGNQIYSLSGRFADLGRESGGLFAERPEHPEEFRQHWVQNQGIQVFPEPEPVHRAPWDGHQYSGYDHQGPSRQAERLAEG
ncbi:hypothetical protein AX774_g687, partial [Zancudomyces culisetae]